MIPLITIEGPTASGKSDLALKLARELETEIISADSRQVYRYLDICTAKPSTAEMKAVRHHLISIIEPSKSYNAGRFKSDASEVIRDLHRQGMVPLICGGTGLYVEALLQGLFPQIDIDPEIRQRLRERLKKEGLDILYAELTERDPAFAEKISRNDRQRVLRGLEVFAATGLPISEHWRRQKAEREFTAFRILIDPPREQLYARINARTERMLEAGLLSEITSVLKMGFDASSPGLNSVGCKEYLPHLLDSVSLQDCSVLAAQHTRNYAKRQCTWYRKRKFDLTLGADPCNILKTVTLIRAWQKSLH